ncbi:hypothetical protein CXK93_04690 [Stutzerimonas decontaminans]|uniref:Lipoprotein n=2 Tax=Stutzerimonas TaxID=2901164 RepID=A0ABX4W414_9GAMM|nr:hypothetical protein [Stutzerimonas decontaminans]AHY41865.1 hypothetical protein UIB01_04995 [Stutzerimonas decontaminans]MCQ4245140.1 hypothetical protein [Stutzerimonas decontaminans]PNF86105.1 hypothetical protein CXK93_04690 [Stutzerimonas decontaminans]
MVLHAQLGIVIAPAFIVNGLALMCALCGGWLLVATQRRQARALRRTVVAQAASDLRDTVAGDTTTQRINQVFYRFGWAGLLLGLSLSVASQQL